MLAWFHVPNCVRVVRFLAGFFLAEIDILVTGGSDPPSNVLPAVCSLLVLS